MRQTFSKPCACWLLGRTEQGHKGTATGANITAGTLRTQASVCRRLARKALSPTRQLAAGGVAEWASLAALWLQPRSLPKCRQPAALLVGSSMCCCCRAAITAGFKVELREHQRPGPAQKALQLCRLLEKGEAALMRFQAGLVRRELCVLRSMRTLGLLL